MKNITISKIQKNKGAAMMTLVLFVVLISLTILIGIVTPTIRKWRIATDSFNSKQTYFLAESGVEDVLYRLKNSKQINSTETIILGNSQAVTTITDIGGGQKQISTLGDTNSLQRKIDVILNTTTGVSFNYGVLVGEGGVYLDSGKIYGNVYANGPITASSSGGNLISGTAISANSPSFVSDQSNGNGTPSNNVNFGNSSTTTSTAQRFQPSITENISKASVYIKRTGGASDITVNIVNDSNGNVGNTILATGHILSSSVGTSYGWIDVSFNPNPTLDSTKAYWLVLTAGSSSSKYYTIGANNNGYLNGVGKIGKIGGLWNNTIPAGLDYFFVIYLGGESGLIQGNDINNPLHVGTVSGTAQANTIKNVNSTGDIFCQQGVGNNKACIPQPDPTYVAFPISDANISEWKDYATVGGTYSGNYTVGPWPNQVTTLDSKKINGNLSVTSGGTLTIAGTIWVTGNLVINGNGLVKLSSSYGSNDGVIIVDGTISITGGGSAEGSGTEGGYLMLLSLSDSINALNISGDAGALVAYAPNGTMNVSGGSALKEATAHKLILTGNSSITYESGLADNNFSSGPGGTWNINSWKEVE